VDDTPHSVDTAPEWFGRALSAPREEGVVEVDGCPIHHLVWGEEDRPTLVLVHGGAAHARWWSALAPLLAVDRRVVALDMSGHGQSGWREVYRVDTWVEEVLAVARAAGGVGRPIVAGHSMGGFVTIVAAATYGAGLEGAIVLDAPVRRSDPESDEGRRGRMFSAPKTYPDLDTAISHFHLVPPQPCENRWLVEEIARASLRRVDGGWTWRFDPRLFVSREGPSSPSDFASELARVACRFAIVNGERSAVVDADVRAYTAELLAGSPAAAAGIPFVEVPEAQHHLLLDQPLATVTALRAVLASWSPVGAPPATVDASG